MAKNDNLIDFLKDIADAIREVSGKTSNINAQDFASTIRGLKVKMISFTINNVQYQAEEGMTWEDWCNSEYNPGTYLIQGNSVYASSWTINFVKSSDLIVNGNSYTHNTGSQSGGDN